MLESDGIKTSRQFADTFKCLRDGCRINLHPLVAEIGFSEWLTSFWAEGEQLPPEKKWPGIAKAIMRLLETELQKEDA
jgi:hypothetical protein